MTRVYFSEAGLGTGTTTENCFALHRGGKKGGGGGVSMHSACTDNDQQFHNNQQFVEQQIQ